MRADLQRYYGLNLDGLGIDFSAFHAAACLACLPLGAQTLARVVPATQYTYTDYLLHAIIRAITGEEIPYPWAKKKSGIEGIDTEALPFDEFLDWYNNTNWKEDEEWQREIQ